MKEARDRLYHPTPDGYCGDEDNGQTSAWYVWSSLGFYPVCPGSGEYVLGAPAFPKITVTLPGGHPLVITAVATSCDPPLGEAASRRFEKSPWEKRRPAALRSQTIVTCKNCCSMA